MFEVIVSFFHHYRASQAGKKKKPGTGSYWYGYGYIRRFSKVSVAFRGRIRPFSGYHFRARARARASGLRIHSVVDFYARSLEFEFRLT